MLTVTEHLRARGKLDDAGGQAEIDALAGAVTRRSARSARYAKIVKEHSLLRRLLTTTYEIQAASTRTTRAARHRRAGRARDARGRPRRPPPRTSARSATSSTTRSASWHVLSTEGTTLTGTPSGFADLDEITGGFQPGNLIIVAARPSMGKSALVTNFAENVALHPDRPRKAVALFSLEMSESELAQRFVAARRRSRATTCARGG